MDPEGLLSKVLGKLIQLTRGHHLLSKKDFGSSFVWVSFKFPKFNFAYESCELWILQIFFEANFWPPTWISITHFETQPDNGGILY